MAQIIENWTDLEGKVKSFAAVDDPAEHVRVEMSVAKVTAVEGFANLLADGAGKVLAVYLRNGSQVERSLKVGAVIHLRVRRAGASKIYGHPGTA